MQKKGKVILCWSIMEGQTVCVSLLETGHVIGIVQELFIKVTYLLFLSIVFQLWAE
jgi:hypothetical protein